MYEVGSNKSGVDEMKARGVCLVTHRYCCSARGCSADTACAGAAGAAAAVAVG